MRNETHSMFLTPREIKQLTGKIKGKEQHIELNKMGVQHLLRGDGEILVSKSHIEKILDGHIPVSARKKNQPNYGAL